MRYVGEPLALVIAESAALAEDALEAISVDIEAITLLASPSIATKKCPRQCLFEAAGDNLADTITAIRGDADRGLRDAPSRGASISA